MKWAFKTFWWTLYIEIIGWYDSTFDLEINVGHCDLYSWSSDLEDYLYPLQTLFVCVWGGILFSRPSILLSVCPSIHDVLVFL